MSWQLQLNHAHVARWRRYVIWWLAYVAAGLLFGWHLGPRPDEVAFVLALPLAVIVPYGLFCLGAAYLRAYLWPVGGDGGRRRALHPALRLAVGGGNRRRVGTDRL